MYKNFNILNPDSINGKHFDKDIAKYKGFTNTEYK